MDSNSAEDSIQVFIRIRPNSQQQSIVTYTETEIRLQKHQFGFDKIFPTSATQTDIFHHVGNRLLVNVLDGYNSCVFVYGQTGSGKTHTMIGQNNGLMQQSFRQLFSRINRMKNSESLVTCSYFELYNEQIMDLLDPKKQKKLNIRQDAKKGVFVQNLTQQTALDCDKLMEVLYTGMKNRHIGQTQMNRESSRSHSVFTISLSCKTQQNGKKILKTPKLHFVDLAGSERQKMTQASGQRLKEAGNINRSLTTLGMVINALTSQKPRTHIPYRDSKLTCLLRDSLGGNSKTIIIATVSTLSLSFQQTLSTLNFANRAKMVKVKALINEESLSGNIEVFKEEIRLLKAEIMRLKSQNRTPVKIIAREVLSPKHLGSELDHHFEEINKKINAISNQLTQGITSPSLQALLSNLNSTKNIGSTETMMNEEQIDEMDCQNQKHNPSEFIQYLNSNYELLSQINTKITQYTELKEELRHAAMNKKLSIESMLTPSKFERDQYEELLLKRQKEIKQLQEKVEQLQSKLNINAIEKKELQRKLDFYHQKKSDSSEEIEKLRSTLIQKELEFQKEKGEIQRVKTQLMRIQKLNQQLEQRFKEIKQLHLYAEEKYQNQKFNTSKLITKIQQTQKEVHHHKKFIQNLKEQKLQIQNQLENLKIQLEDKESRQEQLKNQLNQLEQTIQFNKKVIEDLTKKNLTISNELHKNKQTIDSFNTQNCHLRDQNLIIRNKFEEETSTLTRQLEEKCLLLKQTQISNQRLNHQIQSLNTQLIQEKQTYTFQFQKNRQKFLEIKRLLNEKQTELHKTLNEMHILQDSVEKIRNYKEMAVQNYSIKYETKMLQNNMLQQKLNQFKTEAQVLIEQLKKQLETSNSKIQAVSSVNQSLQNQKKETISKLNEAQTKLSSIQHIYDENQQFKKSYKELVKENYRLKGKYQNVNQNQQLQKQKNDQLLSKVQFYEQKFNLMSLEYHKIEGIVKKLKQKQLESNKKIQFYQENIKLMQIQKSTAQDSEQKNHLICQLKQQNRQLKYKLDNLQSNRTDNQGEKSQQNPINPKRIKQERQNLSLNMKQDKFRNKLSNLMKSWQGFKTKNQGQISTEEMIDLCQIMLNQNAIKFQTIAKGIRREQKLKSQNHFILKQNIYLKQKVERLQKSKDLSQQKQGDSKPRKVVKTG